MIENLNLTSTPLVRNLSGLNTDVKPTKNIGTGSRFFEINTGDVYVYSALNVNPITNSGWWKIPGVTYKIDENDIVLVNTDTINDTTKVPSSAVTFALGKEIDTINDNLFSSGVWSPTLEDGGSSITINDGQWFKIGKLVFLSMATWQSAITNPNANPVVLSIPFPAVSTRNYGITGYNDSGIDFYPLIAVGFDGLMFGVKDHTNGAETNVVGTDLPNATFQFSIMYVTN